VSDFPEIFGARKSIESVSSCVFVRLLFLESILMIGSFAEPESHFCTSSLDVSVMVTCRQLWDTVLYTMYRKDLWSLFVKCKGFVWKTRGVDESLHRPNFERVSVLDADAVDRAYEASEVPCTQRRSAGLM